MRILIAEDERSLNRIIAKQLKSAGYSVDCTFDGEEAYDFLISTEYDCAVLDINMPKMSGLQLVRRLRSEGNHTPILFLTARDSIEDRVTGLDIGANDYLVKPFAFEELSARIRVLLRSNKEHTSSIINISNLTINTATHEVRRSDDLIRLSAKEYELLRYLAMNAGTVLSRERIENHIWNYDYEGGTNVIDVYIRYLRKKIDEEYEPKLIHTVRGAGYVLRED